MQKKPPFEEPAPQKKTFKKTDTGKEKLRWNNHDCQRPILQHIMRHHPYWGNLLWATLIMIVEILCVSHKTVLMNSYLFYLFRFFGHWLLDDIAWMGIFLLPSLNVFRLISHSCCPPSRTHKFVHGNHLRVFPKMGGEITPKSSILIGVSTINHPFSAIPIFGNTHPSLPVIPYEYRCFEP